MMTLRRFVGDATADLNHEIRTRSDKLGRDNCKDWAEYKKQTGIIAGLSKAIDVLHVTLDKTEHEEDVSDLPEMEGAHV